MLRISLVLYMMTAVCIFVGIYHLAFFFNKKTEKKHLLFSLLCFAHVPYFIAQAEWYSSITINYAFISLQTAFGSMSIMMIVQLLSFYYYTEKSFGKNLCYINSAVFGIFFILSFITSGLTFTPDSAYRRELGAFRLFEATVYEFSPGIMFQLFILFSVAQMLFLLFIVIWHDLNRYGSACKPMPIAFGVVLLSAVHDSLSAVGVINSIYLGEFSYMLLIFTMAYGLMNDSIAAQNELESLTTSLDARVAKRTRELTVKKDQLVESLAKVKILSGFLPICANCKKIRDDQGYWSQIENYISSRSEAEFSHGICPDCMKKLYPDYVPKAQQRGSLYWGHKEVSK